MVVLLKKGDKERISSKIEPPKQNPVPKDLRKMTGGSQIFQAAWQLHDIENKTENLPNANKKKKLCCITSKKRGTTTVQHFFKRFQNVHLRLKILSKTIQRLSPNRLTEMRSSVSSLCHPAATEAAFGSQTVRCHPPIKNSATPKPQHLRVQRPSY